MALLEPSPQVYKGAYSIMVCAHGCGKKVELGPRHAAEWAWCALCQRPICKKPVCMGRCPRRGWFERWDQSQWRDKVSEYVKDDVDRRWKPGDDI